MKKPTGAQFKSWRELQDAGVSHIFDKYDRLREPITSEFKINTAFNEDGREWLNELITANLVIISLIKYLYVLTYPKKACCFPRLNKINIITQKIEEILEEYLNDLKFGPEVTMEFTTQDVLNLAQVYELTFAMQGPIRGITANKFDLKYDERELREKLDLEKPMFENLEDNYDSMICCLFHLFDASSYEEQKSNYYTPKIKELFYRIIFKFDFQNQFETLFLDL